MVFTILPFLRNANLVHSRFEIFHVTGSFNTTAYVPAQMSVN